MCIWTKPLVLSIFFLLNLFLYVRFLMARASHNHNFFGFLVIFGSSSTSNSPLQPFFRLQVFQNEKSYTLKKKKKKILPSHCCPATCQKWKSSNFSMHSCTLHVLYFLVLVLKQTIHNTSIMCVYKTVYPSTREGSNWFSRVQFIIRLDWIFYFIYIYIYIHITANKNY